MKKILSTTILLLIVFPVFLFAQESSEPASPRFAGEAGKTATQLLAPQITISPQTYIAGEQTLYLEGAASPNSEITIYLKRQDKTIKRWLTSSNEKGNWLFKTDELIESGNYYLVARVEKHEVVSEMSEKRDITIRLSGVAIGSFLISFKSFTIILGIILALLVCYALWFIVQAYLLKKHLRQETWEIREMLNCAFDNLDKEVKQKIEFFDSQPGFSATEKRVYEDLHRFLLTARISIEKEIKDVENIIS